MSQMILRGHKGAEFKLNVTQFRSTMNADITTVQTRKMAHHFPVRAGQPDVQFTVQFRSIDDHHAFRDFVRDHQRNSQTADHSPTARDNSGMVSLFWPERGIKDWKGYITSLPVREARFDYAPRLTFGVMLTTSMLTERTYNSSLGNSFFLSIIANQVPILNLIEDSFIQLPTTPISQQQPTDPNNSQQYQDQQEQVQNSSPGPTSAFYDYNGGVSP